MHIIYMAKKVTRVKITSKVKPRGVGYEHYLIPSVIGAVIAWFFSDSFVLGVIVFIAVLIGNYIGFKILQKR